jgi:hypothetical protein
VLTRRWCVGLDSLGRRMHTFMHESYAVWGLTAETLVRLCVLTHPTHTFPYDTAHPDGTSLEEWFTAVVGLPDFAREVADVERSRRKRRK